ncbi:MAG TPA: ATP-binding protein, partial [Clostridia bacterium]|nr:ATP-binding protein [Clostridia bacterium]
SRDAGGTGLGLAIVKHIMITHGGSVELESGEGLGTSFLLRFPG